MFSKIDVGAAEKESSDVCYKLLVTNIMLGFLIFSTASEAYP